MRLQYYKSQSEEKSQNQEDKGFSLHLSQQASFNLEYQWDQMDQIDYFIYPILDQFSIDDCQYHPDQDVNNQDFQEQRNVTPAPPRQDDGDIYKCSSYYDVNYEQQYERPPDQVESENRISDRSGIIEDQDQILQQQFSKHYDDQQSEFNQQYRGGGDAYDQQRKKRKADSQEIIFQYNPQSQTQNQGSCQQERNQQISQQQQQQQGAAATKKKQKLENKSQQQLEKVETQDKKKKISDKHQKLIYRFLNIYTDEQKSLIKFPLQEEFRVIFQSVGENLKLLDVEAIPEVYNKIKMNMEWKLKDFDTDFGKVGFYALQITMLIAKLILNQERACSDEILQMIIQDLVITFNDNDISFAINQIYWALTGWGELNMDVSYWKGLIEKLKYQFEVDRQHQKSNCTNYRLFMDNKYMNCQVCTQKIDQQWYNLGGQKKDYIPREDFMNVLERGQLDCFLVNHQMKQYKKNNQRKNEKKFEIHLDDILNIIAWNKSKKGNNY